MAFYLPPTQNLGIFDPDVFDQNDEPLTIETGSKYFLRFPMAQAGETLQAINVLGNTRLYKPLIMASTEQTEREIQTSYVTYLDTGNVAGRYSEIVQNGFNFNLTNRVNQGAINLNVLSAGGVQATPIIANFVNTIIANNLQANSTSEFKRAVSINDTTDINNRRITSTFYDFYDAGVLSPLNSVGTIYNQSGAMYIQNTFNGGSISLVVDETGGTQVSPLQVFPTSVNVNKQLQIATNTNITMPNGTGVITQQRVSGDVSSANTLKKTTIAFNSGTNAGSGNTTLDILDNFNNKGLYILCNSGAGSLSPTNREGDVVIGSRNEDNGCVTISNYNNNYQNGMRVFTTKSIGVDNCATILYNGQSTSNDWAEFRMAYDRITLKQTTSFNHPINFNPTTPFAISSARRKLEGLGTLSFTDVSGNATTTGSITSSIWTDSSLVNSLNGMYYNCGIDSGFHQFLVKDSAGNVSTPVYYGSNLTSISNTFVVRNATTPSNRLDILTDTSQNTYIRSRSTTASTEAHIHFNCDSVSALGVVTTNAVMNMTPFHINYRRPIQFNYLTTPSINTQLGFLTSATITTTAFSTQTTPNNLGSLSLGIGTWEITLLISFQASGNHSYSTFSYGINSATGAFPTAMPYLVSYMREPNLTINAVTITKQISMTLQLTSTTTIYFVEQVVFTGGGTTTIGANYNYTRIG